MPNYKLIFCDAATGILLDQSGEWHLSGDPLPEFFYETQRDAELAAREYMTNFISAECVLTNLATGDETRLINETS